MKREELHRELESYLARRRRMEKRSSVFVKKPEDVHMPPDVEPYEEVEVQSKKSWLARLFGFGEEEAEKKDEVKPVDEVVVKSVIDGEQLRSDLKEVARIALASFKELPVDKLNKLKSSPDFDKFKDILRRNGIIK